MLRFPCRLVLRICVLVFFASLVLSAQAQLTTAEEKGLPPNSVFHGGDIDVVNLQNGNLHISIPILTSKQRGGKALEWALVYDSASWRADWKQEDPCTPPNLNYFVYHSGAAEDVPDKQVELPCPLPGYFVVSENTALGSHWRLRSANDWDLSYTDETSTCPYAVGHEGFDEYQELYAKNYWVVHDWQGSAHPIPVYTDYRAGTREGSTNCQRIISEGPAEDSSGIYVKLDPVACPPGFTCNPYSGSYTGTIFLKDGTQITPAGFMRDTNGNLSSVSSDTLGRTPLQITHDPNYYSIPRTQPSYDIYTTTDSNGNPATYRIDYDAVVYRSNICNQVALTGNVSGVCQEVVGGIPEVTRVTLPDGRAYEFSYNSSSPGELSKVILPTGASIEYEYQGLYEWKEAAKGALLSTVGGSGVTKRTVVVEGHRYPWTYNITLGGGGVVTNPSGATESHGFTKVVASYASNISFASTSEYENQVTYADANGHVYKTVKTDYAANAEITHQVAVSVRPIRVTTTLDDGRVAKVETDYETFPYSTLYGSSMASRMNPTEVREYNYGAGGPGDLLRRTTYQYHHNDYPAYVSQHIVDKPTRTTIYDGAGNKIAETLYEYDDYLRSNPLLVAGAVRHDATFDPSFQQRGNVTAVSRWLNTSNSYLTEVYQYDDAGNRIAARDGNGHQTTYDYADRWGDNTCNPNQLSNSIVTGQAKAFVTQVTNAKGQVSSSTINSCTGTTATATDANSQTTTFTYGAMNRLTRTAFPDQGWSATCYSDDPNGGCAASGNLFSVQTQGGNQRATTSTTDGLGRVTNVDITGGPQAVHSGYAYDQLGRLYSATNPYYTTQDPTYGTTYHHYDALGRELHTDLPDGSSTHSEYSGLTVDIYDEAGVHWQRTSDLLGLRKVLELGTAANPLHLETDYDYDALGNLTAVHQLGDGTTPSVERRFQYDSLSRLTAACNPETLPAGQACDGTHWSTTYNYDNVGNLLSKTDARGVTTSYTYDALNRVLQRSANDGTRTQYYRYDGQGFYFEPLAAPYGTNAIGRLSHTSDATHIASLYAYDAMGRMVLKTDCLQTDCSYADAQSATYDLAGNMTSLTYPDGRSITQTFDGAGRLGKVSSGAVDYFSGGNGANAQYWPSGALQSATLGNGVVESVTLNNRLQPCRGAANSPALPSAASGWNLMDRQSFFNPSATNPCGSNANNNGNIYAITDNLQVGWSQSFDYDPLNRLRTAARSDGGYNHTYNYDSFGNMVPHDNLASANAVVYAPDTGNHMLRSHAGGINGTWTDLLYDASGNLTQYSDGIMAPTAYSYNATGQLLSINGGNTASYLYDAQDNRVFKQSPTGTTDYVYFNGQPIAEKDQNGWWTDYIYANGKKIAKVEELDRRVHTSGTFTSSGNELRWDLPVPLNSNGTAYVAQAGDRLCWRQFNEGGAWGGPVATFSNGLNSLNQWTDTAGVLVNQSGTPTQWLYRCADMTVGGAATNATLTGLGLTTDAQTPAGTWHIYYGDMVIAKANGALLPIITSQMPAPSVGSFQGGNWTGTPTAVAETPWEWLYGIPNYYLDDQLGTSQMELSSGGWPLWQGQFTPFGQELDTQATAMHYKFTGKERDTESGLDYFGARYYGSSMGRFQSPDQSPGDADPIPYADITNPQSLNLYSYVLNSPVTNSDPDGHDCVVQSRIDDNHESVSVSSGTCAGVKTGSGQSATYVPGTVTGISANGGNSIDIGYNSYDGQSSGVENTKGAPAFDHPGIDGPANAAIFGQIGNGGMAAIKAFVVQSSIGALTEGAGQAIGMGVEAFQAGRAAKAASQAWKFGAGKSAAKWANQLLKRGWTESEITEAIASGERVPAVNNINPANGATRYISPTSGKSVVVDNVTQEVLHVGGAGFKY